MHNDHMISYDYPFSSNVFCKKCLGPKESLNFKHYIPNYQTNGSIRAEAHVSKSLFLVISGLPAMVAAKQGPEKFGMLLKCGETQLETLVDDSKWHSLVMVVQFWDLLSTFSRLRVRFWYLHCWPFPILVRLWQTLTIKARFVNLFYWSGKWAAYRCLDLARFVEVWLTDEWEMLNRRINDEWWIVSNDVRWTYRMLVSW